MMVVMINEKRDDLMYIKVLVELSAFNIDKMFTYHVPNDLKDKIKIGIRVLVPFNHQKLEGFVLEIEEDISLDREYKDILDVVDSEVILNEELLKLGKKISEETLSTLISSYQVMLPKALKAKNGSKVNIKYRTYVEIDNLNIELSIKQQAIIDKINEKGKCLYSELKKINTSVDTLIKKGILRKIEEEEYRLISKNDVIFVRHELNEEQKKAYEEIRKHLDEDIHYLLFGCTGSGKTEVYMELMEQVIAKGKTCLLLVPEITLTNQILWRMKSRFKRIAVLHSGLSDGERYDEYRKIKRGEVDLVIGARSSIFAPLTNIGLIVIDECHVNSYQQDVMPRYDAIMVAKERCKYHKCPLVLGSATPTIDMYARSTKNIYHLLTLSKRAGKARMPKIVICDMTQEEKINHSFFSKTLYDSINECLNKKEQVILLQNRRGYSSMVMCPSCGYVMKCPNCDISLTYHKNKDLMRCHYCGYANKKVLNCPQCQNDELQEFGLGTEKIEEELKSLFPKARIIRMDLDTTSRKGSHEKIIASFANYEYDILLGTQMIAKGLDFKNVTLVGVMNADTSLFLPSYLSSENTFNLLSQVSGRSGRNEKEGKVIIQTYNPSHYAITLASQNDYLSFYQEEMKNRLTGRYPPFFYLVEVIIKASDYDLVSKETNKIKSLLENKLPDKIVIGPSMMHPFKVNNIYRFSIIMKYKKEENLKKVLKDLINHYKANNKIKIEVSFNPYDI